MKIFIILVMALTQLPALAVKPKIVDEAKIDLCLDISNAKKVILHGLKSKKLNENFKANIKSESENIIEAYTTFKSPYPDYGTNIKVIFSKEMKNKTKLQILKWYRNGRNVGPYRDFHIEKFKKIVMDIYERWPEKTQCK